MADLLDSGYEIKSTLPISAKDRETLWPNEPVPPYVVLILPKGASISNCGVQMIHVSTMAPATFTESRGWRTQ